MMAASNDVVVELVKAGANLDLQNKVGPVMNIYRYSKWSITKNIILLFVHESWTQNICPVSSAVSYN